MHLPLFRSHLPSLTFSHEAGAAHRVVPSFSPGRTCPSAVLPTKQERPPSRAFPVSWLNVPHVTTPILQRRSGPEVVPCPFFLGSLPCLFLKMWKARAMRACLLPCRDDRACLTSSELEKARATSSRTLLFRYLGRACLPTCPPSLRQERAVDRSFLVSWSRLPRGSFPQHAGAMVESCFPRSIIKSFLP